MISRQPPVPNPAAAGGDAPQSEGDSNLSPHRRAWTEAQAGHPDRDLMDADAEFFFHQSLSTPCLAAIRKAEGIWVEDALGRRYMDFHGNNVHHIGYGHPRLIEAVKRQIDELPYTPRRFTSEPAVALARKLAEITPGRLGKVLFATGGSDAVDMALKLARVATGRFKTISFWDSFHGAGFGGMSVGGESLFRGDMGPLLPGTEHVPPFACYRCPYGYRDLDGGPDVDAADRVMYRALEKGLSFKTTMGNVLTLTPPLVITIEDMDRALDIIEESLEEEENRSPGPPPGGGLKDADIHGQIVLGMEQ